jgi:hypothetical protein
VRDRVPDRPARLGAAAQGDGAAVEPFGAGDRRGELGLARPHHTGQPDDLARPHVEVDVGEQPGAAAAAQLQHRLVGPRAVLLVLAVVVDAALAADHQLVQAAVGDGLVRQRVDDPAVAQDDEPAAEPRDVLQDVRDVDERRP